jgi:hypothetical protein
MNSAALNMDVKKSLLYADLLFLGCMPKNGIAGLYVWWIYV